MLVGQDWKEFFDVVIVQARKPKFFTDVSRPFRVFDEQSGSHIWGRVTKLEKGVIYYEVSINRCSRMMQFLIAGHSQAIAGFNRMARPPSFVFW